MRQYIHSANFLRNIRTNGSIRIGQRGRCCSNEASRGESQTGKVAILLKEQNSSSSSEYDNGSERPEKKNDFYPRPTFIQTFFLITIQNKVKVEENKEKPLGHPDPCVVIQAAAYAWSSLSFNLLRF